MVVDYLYPLPRLRGPKRTQAPGTSEYARHGFSGLRKLVSEHVHLD